MKFTIRIYERVADNCHQRMNKLSSDLEKHLSFDVPDIRQTLLQFQKDDYMCDTVLISSDGRLRAHSVVLAAASEVFKLLLETSCMREEHHINLPRIESHLLEVVIHFAYSGDVVALEKYASVYGREPVLNVLKDLGLQTTSCQSNDDEKLEPGVKPKLKISCDEPNDSSVADDELISSAVKSKHTGFGKRRWRSQRSENSTIRRKRSSLASVARKKSKTERIAVSCAVSDQGDVLENREDSVVNDTALDGKCDDLSAAANVECEQQSHACDICEKEFQSLASLGQHRRAHFHADKPHTCSDCGRRFARPESLVKHQHRHAADRTNRGSYVKPLSCTLCSLRFSSKLALGLHAIRRHASALGSRCPVCDEDVGCSDVGGGGSSVTLRHLADHMPFRCEFCGQVFIFQHPFQLHRLVHTDDRPHVCETCGKSFKSRTEVVRHRRVHTDERRFICTTCGRRFNEAGNLTRHMRIHAAVKPFECSICGKRIQEANYFKQHMWRHTGEKPFSCKLCDKSYKTRAYLRFHSQSVHKVEPSASNSCPTKPTNKSAVPSGGTGHATDDSV